MFDPSPRDVHDGTTTAAMAVAARQRQIFYKITAAAPEFFFEDIKKCMNSIEFQCLEVKQPETE
jgi:hypothetical protein